MTTKRLEGIRTLLAFFAALGVLLGAFLSIHPATRWMAFGAFAAAVVAAFGSLTVKSSVGVLANGTGTNGAWETLTTDRKPGGPPPAPPPPAAGFVDLRLLLWVLLAACVLGSCGSCTQIVWGGTMDWTSHEILPKAGLGTWIVFGLSAAGFFGLSLYLGRPKPPGAAS